MYESYPAKITGDPSWSWDGVLPYFKSYEDYEDGGDSKLDISFLILNFFKEYWVSNGGEF